MFRCAATVFVALLGAAVVLPAEAQWKWLDRNRQVQYSDLPPPPEVSEKDILQRPGSAQRPTAAAPVSTPAVVASAPPLQPKVAEPELEAKRRQADADEAARKKVEDDKIAAAKAENCNRARSAVRTLESGVRIARANDKGEREILDDAARAADTRRAREVIVSDCR